VGGTEWQWELPESYNNPPLTQWADTVLGAPSTFTASISGTIMTTACSSGVQPGLVLTSGAADRTVVSSLISGTIGGGGTCNYVVSISQTLNNAQVTGQMWLPANGQGVTDFNWMSNHP
jgi:hypothetical protein